MNYKSTVTDNNTYHHLSIEERKEIESLLNTSDITLKLIANKLNRSPKCIRYELKAHRIIRVRANQRNKCGRQEICDKHRLCVSCINGFCKGCSYMKCNELCEDFIDYPICKKTSRYPYVCNSCKIINTCKLPKYFYIATSAQSEYETNKVKWRLGPKKSISEIKRINEVFSNSNGQSIDVLIHNNDLNISLATAYRYIDKCYIEDVRNIDLKRKVRYSKRISNNPSLASINYDYLKGRKYEDFLKRIANETSDINIWEMDTVIGKKEYDEKCILSLLHRRSNLQLYFLLNHKNTIEVNKVFDEIKRKLGNLLFKEVFPIILTDNGSEFKDPITLETDNITGEKLISIYYCEPRRSDQKGKCEKNHEHLREILPKYKSFNSLSKKDINHVSLMVNNYSRKIFNYHSPLEVAMMSLNKKVLDLNELKYLTHTKVNLKPII